MKLKTQEQFISELKKLYGDKYDLSPVVYNGYRSKVSYICPIHGMVESRADRLLYGKCGCPKCGLDRGINKRTYTKDEIVNMAKIVHGNKYDYSLITDENYKTMKTKVPIICPEHGLFYQTMFSHVYRKNGCLLCGYKSMGEKSKIKITTKEFIQKANIIHKNFYNYSLVDIKYTTDDAIIICPIHGQFLQNVKTHLSGHGCYKCGRTKTTEKLSQTGIKIKQKFVSCHSDLYDYDMILDEEYYSNNSKVPIICKKHGLFYQTVGSHVNGHGCPHCAVSKGEVEVSRVLDKMGVEYIKQYRVKNEDLFCENKKLVFDFYLPKHNIVIEYNGIQHYKEIEKWKGKGSLEKQTLRDNAVKLYCRNHKIKLIEIPYTEYKNINIILSKKIKKNQ